MTDQEKLPAKAAIQSLAVSGLQRGSLAARGLLAIQNGAKLAQTKDNDALYRQARDVYDLISDNNGGTWFGKRKALDTIQTAALSDAFATFQRLASEGYGKAYYPLSMLFGGKHSLREDASLAQHFAKQATDWCLANSSRNDPEIWNDLGCLYMDSVGAYNNAIKWFRKAAEQGHANGALNLSTMLLCSEEICWEESEYWQIKAAELGNLGAIRGQIYAYELESGPYHKPYDEGALHWYRKAAEHSLQWGEDEFRAQTFFDLGMRFRYGSEANQDRANEYFLAASNLGHPEAQYQLAEPLSQNGDDSNSNLGSNWKTP